MNERDIEILKSFSEEKNPSEVYELEDWEFSRATFYRRLDKLKKQGLIEWRTGRAEQLRKVCRYYNCSMPAIRETKFSPPAFQKGISALLTHPP